TISDGLRDGFRSVLPQGVYPVAFLFVEIPSDEIDVNVHPAKVEIRFRRTEAVKDAISEAVRDALSNAGILGDELVADSAPVGHVMNSASPILGTSEQQAMEFAISEFDPVVIESLRPDANETIEAVLKDDAEVARQFERKAENLQREVA